MGDERKLKTEIVYANKYTPTYAKAKFPEDEPKVPDHPVMEYFFHMAHITSPYPYDSGLFKMFIDERNLIPEATEVDGNYVVYVGDGPETFETMFIAHIDTADSAKPKEVKMIYNAGVVRTDNTTLLGADNKGGVAILLYMIDNGVPGTYWFVKGEEKGRIGSTELAKQGWGEGYKRAIQFDRYGTKSIITYQSGRRSCSDEFADALADELSSWDSGIVLDKDTGGSYTDTYSFFDTIPECTNIAAGYYDQHSVYEHQDMTFLIRMAEAAISIPWHELPTVQDPKSRESSWKQPSRYGGSWGKFGDEETWWDVDFDGQFLRAELEQDFLDDKVSWKDVYELVLKYPSEATDLLHEILVGTWDPSGFSVVPTSRVKERKSKKGRRK